MSTRPTQGNRTTGPDMRLIAVVVVLLVGLAVLAFAVVGGGDDDAGDASTGPQYGDVSTTGAVLPPLPDGGDDPAVGNVAPSISSERDEQTTEVDPGTDGTPTMLVFLAHWCPHCQAELPELVELADDGAFSDIRTVAVLTSTDPVRPNHPPEAWLDREGWQGDRLYDDESGTAAAAYGVTSFPFTVFLDENGAVTQRFAGGQPAERIAAAVDEIRP